MEKLFTIIHEDADLLVIHKPADLVCHPTKGDEYSSLISRVRLYLKDSAIPHLVNRLDRETSGLVVIAKNIVAARELGQIWETRAVRKEYMAIVHGHVADEQGLIDAPLGKDLKSIVAIKDCVRPDGVLAQTEFIVNKRFTAGTVGEVTAALEILSQEVDIQLHFAKSMDQETPFTILRVIPRSGRKHQIRIHLAHIGHPIVGDKIYGGDEDLYLALVENRLTESQRNRLILNNHALCAESLIFTWRSVAYEFHSTPPDARTGR